MVLVKSFLQEFEGEERKKVVLVIRTAVPQDVLKGEERGQGVVR